MMMITQFTPIFQETKVVFTREIHRPHWGKFKGASLFAISNLLFSLFTQTKYPMKKQMFILVLITIANLAVAQGLQKGNLFGVHLVTVELKPNVKMDEFKTFFVNEVLPQYEKSWVGLKGYLVKSVRGEYKDRFFIVWLF